MATCCFVKLGEGLADLQQVSAQPVRLREDGTSAWCPHLGPGLTARHWGHHMLVQCLMDFFVLCLWGKDECDGSVHPLVCELTVVGKV